MLGNQARAADQTALDAFNSNLRGVDTFANVNNMLGSQELARNELLGNLANMADSQALGAQNANIAGLNAFGNLASSADSAETNRYQASTSAMNAADRTALDRMNSGADIAFRGDENQRANYQTSMGAARDVANLGMDRTRTSADIANTLSGNDLNRLDSFNRAASGAESSRQARMGSTMDAQFKNTEMIQNTLQGALKDFIDSGQGDAETYWQMTLLPKLQAAQMDQKQIDQVYEAFKGGAEAAITKKS
jgi:hypothetical protein